MIWRTDNWGQVAEWMPHQTTTLPKWMFFQKTFLRIILAAKWLVRHSNTSPQTAAKDFAFSSVRFFFYALYILQGCLADSDLLELLNAGPLQHWSLHSLFCRGAWLTVTYWSCWMLVPSSTDHFTVYSAGMPGWQWTPGAAECWSPPALITSLYSLWC